MDANEAGREEFAHNSRYNVQTMVFARSGSLAVKTAPGVTGRACIYVRDRSSGTHGEKCLKSWYSIEIYAMDWFRELGSLAVEAGIVVDVGRQLGGEGGRAPRASGIRLGRPGPAPICRIQRTALVCVTTHILYQTQHAPPCGIHTNNQ